MTELQLEKECLNEMEKYSRNFRAYKQMGMVEGTKAELMKNISKTKKKIKELEKEGK